MSEPSHNVRIHFHTNRLSTLVNRPGGAWRREAIAEATRRVESLRESSMDAIDGLIGLMETVYTCRDHDPAKQATELQRHADSIITLAGTFGLSNLAEASKRLCDLVGAQLERGKFEQSILAIFVRTIRMFGPKSPPLPQDSARAVLDELQRVLRHLNIEILEEPEDTQESKTC